MLMHTLYAETLLRGMCIEQLMINSNLVYFKAHHLIT